MHLHPVGEPERRSSAATTACGPTATSASTSTRAPGTSPPPTTSSPPTAPGPYANYCCNNNTGNLTLTNNWTTNGATNVLNGDHGNIVSGNTTVTNGNWPPAAQSIITNAGIQPSSGGATTGALRGVGSSRCLDVPNASQTDGTFLDIWDCTGSAGQQWTLTSSNQLTVYGSKCLDVPGHATAAGTRVEIWTCNGGANQQWRLNSDGTVVGAESGLCLDVTGQATANGTAVEIWTCNGGSNQKWTRS